MLLFLGLAVWSDYLFVCLCWVGSVNGGGCSVKMISAISEKRTVKPDWIYECVWASRVNEPGKEKKSED